MADTVVRMPKLADTLVEGTLGQWLKQVGEQVGAGEPLAAIETDKVTTELTSPATGTLLEVLVAEGQTVPIETPIARIGAASAAEDAPRAERPPAASAAEDAEAAHRAPQPPAASAAEDAEAPARAEQPAAPPKPTPVAARLLAEHGLTSESIPTRSSRLTRDDVLAYVAARTRDRGGRAPARAGELTPVTTGELAPASAGELTPISAGELAPASAGELIPLSSMRRAIAEHMARARQTIPHGQTVMDADLTSLVAWREQHKQRFQQREGAKLTFTVLFVRALARAIAEDANLGVAVAVDSGLIVPVLRKPASLSLGATARAVADLAARARERKLAADDTQGAQMTITNVGTFGNVSAAPIVPVGQRGILGPGLVERRPLPGPDGSIRIGWRCLLSLMFDRRALDDFQADRLLRRVVSELSRIPEAAD